jgi:hypothetical protein
MPQVAGSRADAGECQGVLASFLAMNVPCVKIMWSFEVKIVLPEVQ